MTYLSNPRLLLDFFLKIKKVIWLYAALAFFVAIFEGFIFGYFIPTLASNFFQDTSSDVGDGRLILSILIARAIFSICAIVSIQKIQEISYVAFSQFFWEREFLKERRVKFDGNLKLNSDHSNGSARLALILVNLVRLSSDTLLALIITLFLAVQLPTPIVISVGIFFPFLLIVVVASRTLAKQTGVKLTKTEWKKNGLVADCLNQKQSIFYIGSTIQLSKFFMRTLKMSASLRFLQSIIPSIPKISVEIGAAFIAFIFWMADLVHILSDQKGLLFGAGIAILRLGPIVTKITGAFILLMSEGALIKYFVSCLGSNNALVKRYRATINEQVDLKNIQREYIVAGRSELSTLLHNLVFGLIGKQGLLIAVVGPSGWGKSFAMKMLAEDLLDMGISVNYLSKMDKFLQLSPALNSLPLSLDEQLAVEMPSFVSAYNRLRRDLEFRSVNTLSDGETAICLVARCIVKTPQVLLLDEIFSSLDVGMRDTLKVEMASWARRRNIIIVEVLHGGLVADVFLKCKG